MKNKFRGYYDLTDSEFKDLWESCIFVFDTNVLLDMYRFSVETRDTFVDVLKSIKERIWIPYQVAKEYHKNLYNVIDGQVSKCAEVINELRGAQMKVQKHCDESRNHPYIKQSLYEEMSKFCNHFCSELEKEKNRLESFVYDNPTKKKLAELFESKVGEKFDEEKLQAIFKEGEIRYAGKIPPGYKDAPTKVGNDKYGDLVIWKEMITMAKEKLKPIVFITSDGKEDWYRQYMGKTISPRAELLTEFFDETGLQFYAYPASAFLSHAKDYFKKTKISVSVIDEISKSTENVYESTSESGVTSAEYADVESHNMESDLEESA